MGRVESADLDPHWQLWVTTCGQHRFGAVQHLEELSECLVQQAEGRTASQELGCVARSTPAKARPWWKEQGSVTREKVVMSCGLGKRIQWLV